jgi:hypothetical protein
MSTDELERLVAASLHVDDSLPVDVHGGRALLGRRVHLDQRAGRRRTLIGIAATVLAIVVTTSLLLTGLRDKQAVPVHPAPPKVALSPSGLPVGLLQGRRDQDGHQQLRIQLLVRADGTGQFSSYPGVAFDVTYRPDGPGRAAIVYSNPVLADPEVVSLSFTVQSQTVTIAKVNAAGTGILSKAGARAIAGSTLRILRAPSNRLCCPDT